MLYKCQKWPQSVGRGSKLHSEMVSGNHTVRAWELKVIGPTCPTEDLKGESNRIIQCEAIINARHWADKSLPAAILPERAFLSVSQKSGTMFKTLLMSHSRLHCPTTVCIHTLIPWHASAALIFDVLSSGDNYNSKRKWKHPWWLPRDAVCTPRHLVSVSSAWGQVCSWDATLPWRRWLPRATAKRINHRCHRSRSGSRNLTVKPPLNQRPSWSTDNGAGQSGRKVGQAE